MSEYTHWFPESKWTQTLDDMRVKSHRYRHLSYQKDLQPIHFDKRLTVSSLRVAVLGINERLHDIADVNPDLIDWYEFSLSHLKILTEFYGKSRVFDLAFKKPTARLYDVVLLGEGLMASYPGLTSMAIKALKSYGLLYSPISLSDPNLELVSQQEASFVYCRSRNKILIAAPALVPGGADRALIDLIHSLSRSTFDVTLATTEPSENQWVDRIVLDVIEFWDLGSMAEDGSVRLNLLQELIRRKSPDLLYIMHSQTGFDSLPWVKRETQATTVAQFHLEEPGGGWMRYALGHYSNLIDYNIVITESLKHHLIKNYYIEPRRIGVIYLGVEQPAEVQKVVHTDQRLHVLFPARLDQQKAPLRLIDIGLLLKEHNIAVSIHVVGAGPLAGKLQSGIHQYGLDDFVTLEGISPPEQMAQWYDSSDVVLLTSDYEGLPLAILEGMGHGRPVVAPNIGAINEIVDPTVGFLVDDPCDIGSYVGALSTLAVNPSLRTQLGFAAYHRVKKQFDVQRTAARYNETFETLLGIPQRRQATTEFLAMKTQRTQKGAR